MPGLRVSLLQPQALAAGRYCSATAPSTSGRSTCRRSASQNGNYDPGFGVARYRSLLELIRREQPLRPACSRSAPGPALPRRRAAAGFAVEGIEFSEEAAKFARERLGLAVRQGAAEDLEGRDAFDVVAAFDTLEHLLRPRDVLTRVLEHSPPRRVAGPVGPEPVGVEPGVPRRGLGRVQPGGASVLLHRANARPPPARASASGACDSSGASRDSAFRRR